MNKQQTQTMNISNYREKEQVLKDYKLAYLSRQISLLGRKEVLTGKAKFGILGDGKEIPQLAIAKVFRNGDWRSGYYRDQTWMLAAGVVSPKELFSQLYGDTNSDLNKSSGGRLMNNHFSTASVDAEGNWLDLMRQKNSSSDISPTAGQMPRLLGLAQASKIYRNVEALAGKSTFSNKGDEIAFGTIGDASTSEGHFFETINAAGVLQVPMLMSVWDDGWGISVSKKYQTTKADISKVLAGFETNEDGKGFRIFRVKGYDYEALCKVYEEAAAFCRKEHMPVLVHVTDLTQPQGHSTSGSHERYKSAERLQWEKDFDGIKKMRAWILTEKIGTEEELLEQEYEAISEAKLAKKEAWGSYIKPLKAKQKEFLEVVNISSCECAMTSKIKDLKRELAANREPVLKDIMSTGKKILRILCDSCTNPENSLKRNVTAWMNKNMEHYQEVYSSHLWSETDKAATKIQEVKPVFAENADMIPGREILKSNFTHLFSKHPEAMIFGEDVGKIGGVNQTLEGLQDKFGEFRVSDTGIREATIIGQGIGLAMRGLRPIAEIQYFDYLMYGLQLMSDDLATLQYRTKGRQKAPLIVSTRGHRLEGIWHAGSPLSMVINSIRGVHVLVPRNMTQAAGFYNTMMQSDESALIIEPLNGYRLKEKKPENIGEFTVPLGVPEILTEGKDVTLVTYGSCVRIAEDAVKQLKDFDINVELIDVQTLLPFDKGHKILESLKKTNKIVFFDEDVPGGATSFMMKKVIEDQDGYYHLDSKPLTITGQAHRAAYSTDGDYFSNPNAEDVFEGVYNMMHEYNPKKYPKIFNYDNMKSRYNN
jgi:pyruvate/2-oxoglutarate/acetoin dehydrogenase E1 component/TPP-dependent pyruvate/acetoin dehydrogenase alpha subunit